MKKSFFGAMMVAVLAGCGGDEATAPEEHAHVDDAALVTAAGDTLDASLSLEAGQTVRLRAVFLGDDGAVVELDEDHMAGLFFDPASLATVSPAADEDFAFDVTTTAPAGTTGTLMIGYGHGGETDENLFGPIAVTVVP